MAARDRQPAPMVVTLAWLEAHAIVPDGFRKGAPFRLYRWQADYLRGFYTVRGDAPWHPEAPVLGPAFVYRLGLAVGPQKVGKNPMIAGQICVEAVGPALFAGWAEQGDAYRCVDWGCGCGFVYPYEAGDPRGMPWPTPLIQITAVSQEATDNTYAALRPMIDDGPLHDLIPHTGEEFIRLPNGGRIDTVTASAPSRLGQRATFVAQDEAGLYTARNGMAKVADTQARNLAGTGGRRSLTTNAWDPAENSTAQVLYESGATDILRSYTPPPANLSYGDKRERRKIHRAVYPVDTWRGEGGHLDLDSIEAEAADLAARDEPQAARFFGNMLVRGSGKAFDPAVWAARAARAHVEVPDGTLVTLGFDGSRLWDATALIGSVVETGYQWPLAVWARPPMAESWEVPVDEVDAVVASAFTRLDVWRMYGDPPYWETLLAAWAGTYGKERVVEWFTGSTKRFAFGMRSWANAIARGELSHCAASDELCPVFSAHVGNAVRRRTNLRDDEGELWTVEKDGGSHSPNKIDCVPAAVLSWEARNDAIAAGALAAEPAFVSVYETRGALTGALL